MRKMFLAVMCAAAVSMGAAGCSAEPAVETTAVQTVAETALTEEVSKETDAAETEDTKAEQQETEESKEPEQSKSPETEAEETAASEEEQTTAAETAKETAAPVVHTGYCFKTGGTTIGMNQDVSTFLSSLGNHINYAESQSCAFKGLDKIYSYPGFDLYTYPISGVDYVNSIYFTDESAVTPEGIKIGSSLEEMLAAYGDGYTEEYGVYTYTKDKSTLSFIVTDSVIESVEYTAITK